MLYAEALVALSRRARAAGVAVLVAAAIAAAVGWPARDERGRLGLWLALVCTCAAPLLFAV